MAVSYRCTRQNILWLCHTDVQHRIYRTWMIAYKFCVNNRKSVVYFLLIKCINNINILECWKLILLEYYIVNNLEMFIAIPVPRGGLKAPGCPSSAVINIR